MYRRSLLATGLPLVGSAVAGCPVPSRAPPPTDEARGVESHMTFFAATPASRPLVVDGLAGEVPTTEGWGRLFTERPDGAVFTDRIEDESPHMRNQVQADRYGERFTVLVQLRFGAFRRLLRVTPDRTSWAAPGRLRDPLEAIPDEAPSADLRTADAVVATTLLIYEYETAPPESVVLPVFEAGEDPVESDDPLATLSVA